MGVLIFLKGGIIFASVDSMSSLAREAGDQRPTGKFSEGSLEKGPRCPLDLKYSCTDGFGGTHLPRQFFCSSILVGCEIDR